MNKEIESDRAELRRLAASLFIVGFHGREFSKDTKRLLEVGPSGVILFTRNLGTKEEVRRLVADLRAAGGEELLVSVDQEGGRVQRLKDGFTRLPPLRELGRLGSTELAFELGAVVGAELEEVGINLNFAPVLDVDTNSDNPVIGDRSFSRDPTEVSRLGVAFGLGLESMGVASSGKHFPGHGDTSEDSHLDLPRLPHSLERLRQVELPPFAAWAHARLATVMTAHVLFDAVDPALPATLSRGVLDLLRSELGYEGVVISDDLEMKAITNHYGVAQAALLGLNAGVDVFLCCHTEHLFLEAVETLALAANHSAEVRIRLERAASRVAALRRRFACGVAPRASMTKTRRSLCLERLAQVSLLAGRDPTEPTTGSG